MDPKERLRSIIDFAPLLREEKDQLFEALTNQVNDDALHDIVSLFAEMPSLVPYFYLNLAAKKFAISDGDDDAFKSVITNEVEMLQNLSE